MKHFPWTVVIVLLLFWATARVAPTIFAAASSADPLTPEEKGGKQIYLHGNSPLGRKIIAFMGDASLEVPGTTLPCANCHGFDGLGKPEGGITPSNITWEYLTKPYGIAHGSGRKHPAYTDLSLKSAITKGIDPAGNKLAVAMPRYEMSQEDLADLISYLKRLGKDQDTGLTETSIRVGTILPAKGPLAEMGQAMKAVITAYFDDINEQGGIYNRRIELRATESADTATIANIKRFIQEEEIFAIAGAFIARADKEIASLMEGEEIPMVGPFTLLPQVNFPLNRYVFYLFSGLKEQARALVDFAAQKLRIQNPRIAIIYPESQISIEVAEAIQEQCKKYGWSSVVRINYLSSRFEPVQFVRELSREGTNIVFFLGSGEKGIVLMKEAEKINWTPNIFFPGSLVGKDILDISLDFNKKIFLSYPALPSDRTRAGLMEYGTLLEKHKLSTRHLAAQLSAYCAAKILVEGLKLAGKDLSREKLLIALEGLYEFDTGLTPRITYGPNQRIGALGAYIVSIDLEKKKFISVSEWIIPK